MHKMIFISLSLSTITHACGPYIEVDQRQRNKERYEAQRSAESTALFQAVRDNNIEQVDRLLKQGANPNIVEEFNYTPLHNAAQSGKLEIVQLLLKHGATVDAPTIRRKTPLHAASYYKELPVVKELLRHGASITCCDVDGCTPLHEAALGGNAALVAVLAFAGSSINAQSNTGLMPLHCAAMYSNAEAMQVLIAHKALVNAPTTVTKETALHFVADDYVSNAPQQLIAARFLISQGASINPRDHKMRIPLHHAVRHKLIDVAQELIMHGADVTAAAHCGTTPLELAEGNEAMTRLLKDAIERQKVRQTKMQSFENRLL